MALVTLFTACGKEPSSEPNSTPITASPSSTLGNEETQPITQRDAESVSSPQVTASQNSNTFVLKREKYEEVDAAALSINCETAIMHLQINADGSLAQINAKVTSLTIADKPVGLKTQDIAQEGTDAYILTMNLGKIMIKFNSDGEFTLWLTASQKRIIEMMTLPQSENQVQKFLNGGEIKSGNALPNPDFKMAKNYDDASPVQLEDWANSGDIMAQTRLASQYFDGTKVLKQDKIAGYKWALVAAASKNIDATSLPGDFEILMTPDEIKQGKTLADEYFREKSAKKSQ